MKFYTWNELTSDEQDVAREQYISIREAEEERTRDEVNDEYPNPIDASYVEFGCDFFKDEYGNVQVII